VPSLKEELREQRLVKIAALQHKIVLPTTDSIKKQKQAILERVKQMIELAAMEGANIVCLQ
jgi:beta-ureidopropionase